MKKKAVFLLLVLTLVTLVLAGCSSKTGNTGADSASAKLKTVKIANYSGAVCFAPLYAAVEKGFFTQEGLNVELVRTDFEGTKEGLATGKIDATLGLFHKWVKPIEQGMDIKFTAGLHTGCIQVVAGNNSGITRVEDLRGKRVGVDAIGAGPMNLLAVALSRAGIDWKNEVTWKAFPPDQLETAMDKGEIDVVAVTDPYAQFIIDKNKGRLILSQAETEPYARDYCCFVAVSGKLIAKDKETAAALTRALMKASMWVNENREEAARLGVEKKYTGGTAEGNARLLAKYRYVPGVQAAREDFLKAVKDLKAAGILEVDRPETLVDKAFAPVTGEITQ
ncbi:putative aliphatic sulfonates-binding protein precursor [Moorella thermoacetica]|uniref:Putative aliphatic sulfonates-binding protein n=1 Tax=Neomoorella thermoacetica TaxID=1525 RepID=A0A1J5NQ99_NEOTH|nr:putative aliphatic sulfonates-binding protein precursor [Moorella thermoacetica]